MLMYERNVNKKNKTLSLLGTKKKRFASKNYLNSIASIISLNTLFDLFALCFVYLLQIRKIIICESEYTPQ